MARYEWIFALPILALPFGFVPAEARFVQADPAGYQDDNNPYTYVGNDPTDKSDPSGETCQLSSQGTAAASCKIDNPPSIVGKNIEQRAALQRKINEFNKRYTATVNKLLANHTQGKLSLPSASNGANVDAIISSQEVGNALASRIITYDPNLANPITTHSSAGLETRIPDNVFVGNARPKFGGEAAGDRGSNIVLTHEGIHGTATEAGLLSRAGASYGDLDKGTALGGAHQPVYDGAAISLYGPDP